MKGGDYTEYEKQNPGVPFTQWSWQQQLAKTKTGSAHPSIGPKIPDDVPWIKSGERKFAEHVRKNRIPRTAKVLDYGCGTLRIGVHFIDHLEIGNYWGIDPTPGMIATGAELIGRHRRAAKKPRLSIASDSDIAQASAWGADFVFSDNVAFHIPPDEVDVYLENLKRLTAKPGAQLTFNARFSRNTLSRVSPSVSGDMTIWYYPVEFYIEKLKPLQMTAMSSSVDAYDDNLRSGGAVFISPTG